MQLQSGRNSSEEHLNRVLKTSTQPPICPLRTTRKMLEKMTYRQQAVSLHQVRRWSIRVMSMNFGKRFYAIVMVADLARGVSVAIKRCSVMAVMVRNDFNSAN